MVYMSATNIISGGSQLKLETFCSEKNLSTSTTNLYSACVKLYEELNQLSIDELIDEADREEEDGVRWKRRKIKDRLVAYRNYLFANKSEGTANRYLGCIKTIYRHFEIELQPLPSFNSKQIDKTYQMSHEDLPTKQEIIDAYHEGNNEIKCIIPFAISSGLSKIDMLNLTVKNFFVACRIEFEGREIVDVLNEIKEKAGNLIPCFKGTRQKTGVKYTTFCSPEAVEHIVQRLLGRHAKLVEEGGSLTLDDKLFDISNSHLLYSFQRINSKLKLGKVGKFNKMRCHMLRKYQASVLANNDIDWSKEEIDALQGRLQDATHRAYIHISIENLYQKYLESVDDLMLFKSINGVDEEAYEQLKTENNFYKKEIVKNESKLEEQERKLNELIRNQKELETLIGL